MTSQDHPKDPADHSLDLTSEVYADRLYGCWQGKNAGGTLGTPLEKVWGEEEPFDVWWYPELQEGGLPNDDLEMQLVWLKALEEVGPQLTAVDLSRYWLDHIGYNFDEYGLSKLNLRWGLVPPLSGHHNNWFKDCMGSPIRSEIWACVTPGQPRLAARYAYQDAICDHAGGEGVHGEVFNATLESAAFVVQDPHRLIDIALSYLPGDSMVRLAVETAVAAHAEGLDWKQARRRVLEATPHYNAQYAPINTGFQIIGLLYGHDFGESICITVNCGYDTDSSGAAIGAYLGVLQGSRELPSEWIEPLGHSIATNSDWGGVRLLDAPPNPVPVDLTDLIERITAVARRVLSYHGKLEGSTVLLRDDELHADQATLDMLAASPTTAISHQEDVRIDVDYGDSVVAVPDNARTITTTWTNRRVEALEIESSLRFPDGWGVSPEASRFRLDPGASHSTQWEILPPEAEHIVTANVGDLRTMVVGRPVAAPVPVTLLGATAFRVSPRYSVAESMEALDEVFAPESGEAVTWTVHHAAGYAMPLEGIFDSKPGVVYIESFVQCPEERDVWILIDPSCPMRYWVNGEAAGGNDEYRRIRPNQNSAEGIGSIVRLRQGWNRVLVKLVHDGRHPGPELHLGFTSADQLRHHQWDLLRTQIPST